MAKTKSNKDAVRRRSSTPCSPIWKPIMSDYWSKCNSADIAELDFSDWWADAFVGALSMWGTGIYLHVSHVDGETRHRVYPRGMRGRVVTRLGMTNSRTGPDVWWIYDVIDSENSINNKREA